MGAEHGGRNRQSVRQTRWLRDGRLKEAAEIIAEALVRKKREDDIALSVQLQAERRAAAAATRTVAAADGSIDARLRAPELRERAL